MPSNRIRRPVWLSQKDFEIILDLLGRNGAKKLVQSILLMEHRLNLRHESNGTKVNSRYFSHKRTLC